MFLIFLAVKTKQLETNFVKILCAILNTFMYIYIYIYIYKRVDRKVHGQKNSYADDVVDFFHQWDSSMATPVEEVCAQQGGVY